MDVEEAWNDGLMEPSPAELGDGAAALSPPIAPLDFSEVDVAGIAARLKAIAHPVRLRMIAFMLTKPGDAACTCELAPAVRLSEPTISHHLKTLEKAGLVSRERRGMNVYYSVELAEWRALVAYIDVGELSPERAVQA